MIPIIFMLLSIVSAGWSVNRDAYKVVLDQSVYPQYLQFHIDMPPLGEFTICTWFKAYTLDETQNLITYAVKGNHEMMKVLVMSGGKSMEVSVIGETSHRFPTTIKSNTWHHVCLSYQSDYAAIALYIDSAMTFCGVMQTLSNYVLPTEGTLILGKTTNDKERGLSGEIYGTNMILASTIEKKYVKNNANQTHNFIQRQKLLNFKFSVREKKNVKPNSKTTNEILFDPNQTVLPKIYHKNKNKFNESNDIQNDTRFSINFNPIFEKATVAVPEKVASTPITLVDYEVPPMQSLPGWLSSTSHKPSTEVYADELSETETPPPPSKETKVYGQWTSSNYAGKLFQFVKSRNAGHSGDIAKNPPSIPLVNNDYPYPNSYVTSPHYSNRRYKRELYSPQINIQIVKDDSRKSILKRHASTKVDSIEVTNRGEPQNEEDNRIARKAAPYNFIAGHGPRIGMKRNSLSHGRLMLPVQYLSSSSEEANANNNWFKISFPKENSEQGVKFGANEPFQYPSKIPITKVVIRKGSDPEHNEISDLNCTNTYHNVLSYYRGKCYQPSNSQYVKVYPKKISRNNLFESDFFEKLFDRNVKLGNALNENELIKKNEEKVSFEGGNEKIPEIQRYFSGLDSVNLNYNVHEDIPGSLSLSCEMAKIHDRLSSSRKTGRNANIAKEFVEISYTQCSLDYTIFNNHKLLLIYWNKSTVSLFGGARHNIATDLCGSVTRRK